MALAETLALEAERVVERNRRLVPGKDVKLELPDAGALGPCDRLVEQASTDAAPTVARGHHQAEVGDVRARRMDVTGEREPADDAVPVLGQVDGGVGCLRTARR